MNALRRRRLTRHRLGTDEGAIITFVVLITVALLAMAGLVIDGGYTLAARQEAANSAEQAARIWAGARRPHVGRGRGPRLPGRGRPPRRGDRLG
jgi:Flp pilus assembly protein TadG